jgi:Ca2+-dependent lipid-binding protein
MDAGESSDPYCKIALGKERYKSKHISNTVNPKWRESFDFYWYEELDSILEMTLWDKDVGKDDFMGRYKHLKP